MGALFGRLLHDLQHRRRAIQWECPQVDLHHRPALGVHREETDIDIEAGLVNVANGTVELPERCREQLLSMLLPCEVRRHEGFTQSLLDWR